MDFTYTEKVSLVIDTEKIPIELIQKIKKQRLLGMPFPQEYGGADLDYLCFAAAIEEISAVDASSIETTVRWTQCQDCFLTFLSYKIK